MFRTLAAIILCLASGSLPAEILADGNSPQNQTQENAAGFYSGSWTALDFDKQWIIKGFTQQRLVKIECEGISNDQEFPSFLVMANGAEYRWPINESGAAFVDLETLALREAGAGQVVFCNWRAIEDVVTKREVVQLDAKPGDNILLGGFQQAREFSVRFSATGGCRDLSAQIYIDGDQLETLDNVKQSLTPRASFFGIGRTVEAKLEGQCPAGGLPVLEFSLAK